MQQYADSGIVFGSAAAAAAMKPDSVRATCEAIGLARSTYYYQSHRSVTAIELEQKIVLRLHELRELHPRDGYRRMTAHLQSEGLHVNRKRIARLMHLHGLSGQPSRPPDGSVRNWHARAPTANLHDSTRLTGPCQVWVTDLAYARIRTNLVYVAVVIDAWSREVIGYAASLQITSRLTRIALHSAVRSHRPAAGCIHHSTCAAHYLTHGYCELLRQYGLIPSIGAPAGRPGTGGRSPRNIIEVQGFESWKAVLSGPRSFIRALYSAEHLDYVLGHPYATRMARRESVVPD
ncbi:MAG: IS3 family transposase [Proteobacteria bacterium]|nr:IS3 family transposase [Pseudomonadota bacterium]